MLQRLSIHLSAEMSIRSYWTVFVNKVVMNCANITRKDSNWENMLKECPCHTRASRTHSCPVLGCEQHGRSSGRCKCKFRERFECVAAFVPPWPLLFPGRSCFTWRYSKDLERSFTSCQRASEHSLGHL